MSNLRKGRVALSILRVKSHQISKFSGITPSRHMKSKQPAEIDGRLQALMIIYSKVSYFTNGLTSVQSFQLYLTIYENQPSQKRRDWECVFKNTALWELKEGRGM